MGTEPNEPREAPEAPLPRGWKLGSMNSKSTRRKASLKPLGKLRFLLCLYWYMYIYICICEGVHKFGYPQMDGL